MKFSGWIVLAITVVLCSCVPNKKLVIAQDKTLKRSQDQVYKHQLVKSTPNCKLVNGDVIALEITYMDLLSDTYLKTVGSEPSTSTRSGDGYTINDSGLIHLPMLGAIELKGLTVDEAERFVLSKAKGLYSQPSVKITLLETYVTILGEVLKPGRYYTSKCGSSIYEVLGLAGGSASMADLEAVKVIRERGDSTSVFFLDLTNETLLNDPGYYILPKDIVYVKPLKRKAYTFQESQQVFRGISIILSGVGLTVAILRLGS